MGYFAGDNNLAVEMVWSLQQLKRTSAALKFQQNRNVNVVAHFHPLGENGRRYDIVPKATANGNPGDLEQDGNLDLLETVVFTNGFLASSVASQTARQVFDVGKGLPPDARERLAQRLARELRGRPLEDEIRRAPSMAAGQIAADFLSRLSPADRVLVKKVNIVLPLTDRLARIAANLVEATDANRALSAFVDDQIETLPAKNYFIILSGHGSGAVGDFLTDSDPRSSLSIRDLAFTLERARQLEHRLHGQPNQPLKRIALCGMDTCLMSTAEVCFEIAPHVDYLIGSEGFVQNAGWPYHRVLEALVKPKTLKTEKNPLVVAKRLGTAYADFYRDYEISGASTDISVANLSAFRDDGNGSLTHWMRAFARRVIPVLEGSYLCNRLAVVSLPSGEKAVKTLAKEIASLLYRKRSERGARRELERLLRTGSDRARELLKSDELRTCRLSPSQADAIVALLDSLRGIYHETGKALDVRIEEMKAEFRAAVDDPGSDDVALAVAKLIREFDPGIEAALELIERREAAGDRFVKGARAKLQKLHQVRLILEMGRGNRCKPRPEYASLYNAISAARGEAQSFKGGVYVDLFDFAQLILSKKPRVTEVERACQEILSRVENSNNPERAIVLSRYVGPEFQHAHGLSVYFPIDAADYLPEYENLAFARQTGWGRLVRSYARLTRRPRRDEELHWAKTDDFVLRYGGLEVDPTDLDTIAARIAAATAPPSADDLTLPSDHKAGTSKKIRAGTAKKIRAGTAKKIKGEDVVAVVGNPPDGFFRQTR